MSRLFLKGFLMSAVANLYVTERLRITDENGQPVQDVVERQMLACLFGIMAFAYGVAKNDPVMLGAGVGMAVVQFGRFFTGCYNENEAGCQSFKMVL